MYTKPPISNDLEQKSISQFDFWAKNWGLKRNWQFLFSNKGILDIIHPQKDMSILDVGCASGKLLEQLSKENSDLDLNGLDISPQMVLLAKQRLSNLAKFKQGSAGKLPYQDNSFDLLTCATSFHHYPNPKKALDEMFRVIKPGGKLLLLDPFTNGFSRKIICKTLDLVFQEKGTHLFTQEVMYRMFKDAGFQKIKQKQYLFYKLITIGEKSF